MKLRKILAALLQCLSGLAMFFAVILTFDMHSNAACLCLLGMVVTTVLATLVAP